MIKYNDILAKFHFLNHLHKNIKVAQLFAIYLYYLYTVLLYWRKRRFIRKNNDENFQRIYFQIILSIRLQIFKKIYISAQIIKNV